MKHFSSAVVVVIFTILGGCSIFQSATIQAGEPESAVLSKLGQPTHRYQEGSDHLLEYATGPWGQQTYMARIGSDGKVISYEQVLTREKFALIKVGETTKEEALRTIGAPSETTYLPRLQLEVWSYPYKESNVWDSIMHVHFDQTGIVRQMLNGPDPRRDPDERFRFGLFRR